MEIFEYVCDYVRKLLNINNIFNEFVENLNFEKEKFDVIIMWLVLEYINNFVDILNRVNSWLRKDGILGVKVFNVDGVIFRSNLNRWIE